jgi:hypothetical protein
LRKATRTDTRDDFRLENENQKLKMTGQGFAKQIVEDFGTNDVFVIAEKAGVKICYESWFPVTIGEFDRKKNWFASI